jgi:hypothetical protein
MRSDPTNVAAVTLAIIISEPPPPTCYIVILQSFGHRKLEMSVVILIRKGPAIFSGVTLDLRICDSEIVYDNRLSSCVIYYDYFTEFGIKNSQINIVRCDPI